MELTERRKISIDGMKDVLKSSVMYFANISKLSVVAVFKSKIKNLKKWFTT